jgi:adenosylmethionine-8-amino-7-oxononanoate aminotransferase
VADDLVASDRAHVWHPYAPVPDASPLFPVAAAHGVRLELTDGRELIDGMSSWWAAIHGYRHPVLDAAVRDQLERMSHVMFGGLTHEPAVRLAERLVELTPAGLDRVFFSDSGSVAVEVAIKMALQHWAGLGRPQRNRLLTVRGGYHGDTFAAMSVCDPDTGMHHWFGDALRPQVFAPRPEPAFAERFEEAHIAELAGLLEAHRDELAAVILEPIVQGAGGMRFYAPAWLRRLRELCDEHDVLLIADEIATGFGRSGRLFACEHAGVRPDILCVGKALTGGYLTLAATLCTDAVAEAVCAAGPGALMHGPTFMANPLATAVALASVDLLVEGPWQQRVASIEGWLAEGLAPARDLPGVADVRVLGAIGVIEAREPFGAADQERLVQRGVWLRPFGRLLYTMPPFITERGDVEQIVMAMVDLVANR